MVDTAAALIPRPNDCFHSDGRFPRAATEEATPHLGVFSDKRQVLEALPVVRVLAVRAVAAEALREEDALLLHLVLRVLEEAVLVGGWWWWWWVVGVQGKH